MSVQPVSVDISEQDLTDLRDRLTRTRWPDSVASGWDYGADVDYLEDLCAYWADGFDWRSQENVINGFSHVRAVVDGISLHAVHERSAAPDAIPILMLHGWPATSIQMLKITPLLTHPAPGAGSADSFHVIAPDLPGYGFSGRPTAPGMDSARIAEILHWLMTRELGYERYAVRASDVGAGVASALAIAYPEVVIGLHLSGSNPFIDFDSLPSDLSPAEEEMVAAAKQFRTNEFAYALLQVSKPQTPAVGLTDSPAGLAAWIVEKYRAWSDCGGDVERAFTRDELLTNLTIYWATRTIASSMRLYYENFHTAGGWGEISVPIGFAMLPADMFRTPREWLQRMGGFSHFTELPRGGHFGEHEVPDLLAADLREFLRSLR